jgi:hypothetical protein
VKNVLLWPPPPFSLREAQVHFWGREMREGQPRASAAEAYRFLLALMMIRSCQLSVCLSRFLPPWTIRRASGPRSLTRYAATNIQTAARETDESIMRGFLSATRVRPSPPPLSVFPATLAAYPQASRDDTKTLHHPTVVDCCHPPVTS